VALPDEPEGWQILQTMAQQERDPQKLASIIDKMNSLLARYESGSAEEQRVRSSKRLRARSESKDKQRGLWREVQPAG
jgi:hypothetical protein